MRTIRLLSLALLILAIPAASFAQFGVSISIAPPAIPVYVQPAVPAPGFLWTPGYWGYGAGYAWHGGYWGPHVGFYGGINYGFGYGGFGYEGGYWNHGEFNYNRSVNNVNVTNIHNTYNKTVINNNTENRVSYNGGEGGIATRPRSEEQAAEREQHTPPVAAQTRHEEAARHEPQQRASVNQGRPAIAATARPGELQNRAAVPRPENAVHPNELPARERAAAPSTGNAKLDQKYQRQQDKVSAQQDKERQKLQQKQDNEHQAMARKNTNDGAKQQVEQRHQQQTQQLQQRHAQQQQHLNQKQQRRA